MRTLLCVRFFPYPPVGGSALRNWQNISALVSLGPVAVLSCLPGSPSVPSVPGVEVWEHVDARPHLDRLKRTRRGPSWLRTTESRVEAVTSTEAMAAFRRLIQDFQPDLVVFEEIWFRHYLPVLHEVGGARCPVVVDNHNVETEVLRARQAIRGGGGLARRVGAAVQRRALFRLEREFCRQADQVWACSDLDAKLLQQAYGLQPEAVHVVPNCVDTSAYEAVRRGSVAAPQGAGGGAPTILYAGSYGYFPNRQAARRLIERIYPIVRRSIPDVRLLLVGPSPTEEMLGAASDNPSIVVTGLVDDVRPYLAAADVVAVPLDHGSGTRLKILEAFAAARPVVSTSKGLEGLEVSDGREARIAEDDEAFADAVVKLLRDADARRAQADAALELVEAQYSFAAAAGRIRGVLDGRVPVRR